MNVVDSSGWIEFFTAGASGPLFKPVIEQRDQLLVPVISIYEVYKILSRKLPAGAVTSCIDVMRLGRVLDLTDRRAVAAADIAGKHKLAMADAVIYSMAREFDATLWTQDVDYEGLAGVKYLVKV
ncbi:MAG: type II toxin-antitoxin system VapC family toxin [Burkholderiaceae bacterium]|nr:type II toxin-antitoxin system VapC family toxin [Burkholderiaceae bacterium]